MKTVLCLTLLISSCWLLTIVSGQEQEQHLSPVEYAVLNAFSNSLLVQTLEARKLDATDPDSLTILPYTIEDRSAPSDLLHSLRKVHPQDADALCDSYLANNRKSHLLDAKRLRCNAGRGIPDLEIIRRITTSDKLRVDRRQFRIEFPDSRVVVQLSRPGFSSNQEEAILSAVMVDQAQPGTGWMSWFLLVRIEDKWSITETVSSLVE